MCNFKKKYNSALTSIYTDTCSTTNFTKLAKIELAKLHQNDTFTVAS